VDQRSVPGMVAEMSRDLASVVERLVSSMQDRLAAQATAGDLKWLNQ
jgi:septum formation topological specificity factor MinE